MILGIVRFIASVVGIFLLVCGVLPILYSMITDSFYYRKQKNNLLKQAYKNIAEAKSWKEDVEFYLNIIKSKGCVTFNFENSYETFNYKRMSNLLEKIQEYLASCNKYVESVKANQWINLPTPNFDSNYHNNIDSMPREKQFDACVSNLVTAVSEKKDIEFLRFLHEYRKNNT